MRVHALTCALLCLAGALLVTGACGAGGHPERPPLAHTGGFGEPTCHACHFDFAAGAGPGRLAVHGLPTEAVAGETYPLTVVLEHVGARAAGFQLAVRYEDGTQAGALEAVDDRVELTTAGDVVYAHQSWIGSRAEPPDTARWRLLWRAPASGKAPILFHAAGLAGDGDLSPLGDHVYVLEITTLATGTR